MRNISMALICLMMTLSTYANVVKPISDAMSQQTKIYYVLQNSKDVNTQQGIADLNNIAIGTQLYLPYNFVDGFDTTLYREVTQGTTAWQLAGEPLPYLEALHGALKMDTTQQAKVDTVGGVGGAPITNEPNKASMTFLGLPWWLWVLLGIGALLLLLRWWNKFTDATGGGMPFMPNGVPQNTEGVVAAANTVASRQGGRIVGPIMPVYLSGFARVRYLNKPNGVFRWFRNKFGYEAIAEFPNGERRLIQFFQQCGNDFVYGGAWYENLRSVPAGQPINHPGNQMGDNPSRIDATNTNPATSATTNTNITIKQTIVDAAEIVAAMGDNGGTLVIVDGVVIVDVKPKPEFTLHLFSHLNGKVNEKTAEGQKA